MLPRWFSAIAINRAYEQNKAIVIGHREAVGLTENTNDLRWMLCGPEKARLINEFEAYSKNNHHKAGECTKLLFIKMEKD